MPVSHLGVKVMLSLVAEESVQVRCSRNIVRAQRAPLTQVLDLDAGCDGALDGCLDTSLRFYAVLRFSFPCLKIFRLGIKVCKILLNIDNKIKVDW